MCRDPETGPLYQATGNGQSILSNRISYFFDLKGPSITIDTACSSSLVGLHLACQGLRAGEADQAIVGGTNLIFSPDIMVAMSLLGCVQSLSMVSSSMLFMLTDSGNIAFSPPTDAHMLLTIERKDMRVAKVWLRLF